MDYIKVFQEKALAVINPLAGTSCLNMMSADFTSGHSVHNLPMYTIAVCH